MAFVSNKNPTQANAYAPINVKLEDSRGSGMQKLAFSFFCPPEGRIFGLV